MTSVLDLPPLDHPWIDSSEAPLYILRYPERRTDAELRAVHECIRVFYTRVRQPVAWVADASSVVLATATERRIIAQHKDDVRGYEIAHNAGSAIVIRSRVVRGAFTAITWVSPFQHPFCVVGDVPTGKLWASARLEEAQRSTYDSRWDSRAL